MLQNQENERQNNHPTVATQTSAIKPAKAAPTIPAAGSSPVAAFGVEEGVEEEAEPEPMPDRVDADPLIVGEVIEPVLLAPTPPVVVADEVIWL